TASIFRALDAGVDGIEHASCLQPDASIRYEPRAGERILEQGVYVTPTLRVATDAFEAIRALPEPTPAQRAYLATAEARLGQRYGVIEAYARLGVRIVAGDDAGWRYTRFDRFWQEVREFTLVGLSPME